MELQSKQEIEDSLKFTLKEVREIENKHRLKQLSYKEKMYELGSEQQKTGIIVELKNDVRKSQKEIIAIKKMRLEQIEEKKMLRELEGSELG